MKLCDGNKLQCMHTFNVISLTNHSIMHF